MGVFCVPKPLVGGFGCDELVLYGIRQLLQQFLGSNLDIEVENSVFCLSVVRPVVLTNYILSRFHTENQF